MDTNKIALQKFPYDGCAKQKLKWFFLLHQILEFLWKGDEAVRSTNVFFLCHEWKIW